MDTITVPALKMRVRISIDEKELLAQKEKGIGLPKIQLFADVVLSGNTTPVLDKTQAIGWCTMIRKNFLNVPKIPGLNSRKLEALRDAAMAEMANAPRIAVIGETGVGKSSTLNAMFNAGLQVDHVRACTKKSEKLNIPVNEIKGLNGSVIIYDMPGLGEDIDADEFHKNTYRKVLRKCDVALWVLDGSSRQFSHTQRVLRDLVDPIMGDLERLVFGINKIDLIEPGKWNDKYNLPSLDQEKNISIKVEDVIHKIGKVCNISKEKIIPFSATKWYRLAELFGAMLDACPEERAWVVYKNGKIADYKEKISHEVLRSLNTQRQ